MSRGSDYAESRCETCGRRRGYRCRGESCLPIFLALPKEVRSEIMQTAREHRAQDKLDTRGLIVKALGEFDSGAPAAARALLQGAVDRLPGPRRKRIGK